jgi:chitinase
MYPLFLTTLILASVSPALAVFDISRNDNVALYWGQNSAQDKSLDPQGPPQQRLSAYCDDSSVDIILLSFLVAMHGPGGEPELNFSNQGCDHSTTPITCPTIEADIKYCQTRGVTIMLSIGGAASKEPGYADTSDAIEAGEKIWAMFGPDQYIPGLIRPFGSAVVDGFDLDFEHPVSHVVAFGTTLSDAGKNYTKKYGGKRFYMSAAPECPLPPPKPSVDATISNVPLDILFVQFYNNAPCDFRLRQNLQQWHDFAFKQGMVFFAGLPASELAAKSGYVPPDSFSTLTTEAKGLSSFRGAMLWDASQAWWNDNYQRKMKKALQT